MPNSLEHLNEFSYKDLRAWLVEALHDRVQLPKIAADDQPDVALLAAEHTLDKPTRRDLRRACRELVREFTRHGVGSLLYLRALLHLASGLDLSELVNDLTAMALRFPTLPELKIEVRQTVLLTIVDLKQRPAADFWPKMFAQDPHAYAGASLSGLLASNWHAGLALLPELPNEPMLANAAAVILDLALDDLAPAERTSFVSELGHIAPRCPAALRETLSTLIAEHQVAHKRQHSSPGLFEMLGRWLSPASDSLFTPRPARLSEAAP